MKKHNRIIMLLLTAVLLTACQPTPSTPVVINKADGLDEKYHETQVYSDGYLCPDRWTQDIQNEEGNVTISIDVPLEVPDTTAYPVINVVPYEITKNDVKKYVNYFFDGKPVYDAPSSENESYLNKSLLQWKYDLITLEQSGKVHYTKHVYTEEEMPEEKARLQRIIKDVEKQLSSFKDTQRNISSSELTTQNDYTTCSITDTSFGEYVKHLSVIISNSNYFSWILYDKAGYCAYDEFEEPAGEKPKGMDMTLEEAESMAKQMLAKIGLEDAVRTYWCVGNYKGLYEQFTGIHNSEQCYVLYFCKPVAGIPITYYYDYEGTTTYSDMYSDPWSPEVIEVNVNNSGLVMFSWQNAGTLTDTINQNVKLLPWEDIKETALSQFKIKSIGQYIYGGFADKMTIKINRITLGMMRVLKRNTTQEYMYIPVWDFFGNYIYQRDSNTPAEIACSILTINAIDGSIIDRGLGY